MREDEKFHRNVTTKKKSASDIDDLNETSYKKK